MTPKTQDKWLSILRQFQFSSLTLKDFALHHGLNPNTFRNYYYRLRHLLEDESEPALDFLPVVFEQAPSFPEPSLVSIRLPASVTLQLDSLPSPEYLKELVCALREV